jgi:F0F1-type ATP synthase alpha subunit
MAELTIRPEEIRAAIERVFKYEPPALVREEVGTVVASGDGIARVEGLPSVMANELVEFEDGTRGIALNVDMHEIDGRRELEAQAPGVMQRQPVHEPLQTGIKAIDALTPIGRGQRQLIIGDRQTGKTTIALDTILNQRAAWKTGDPDKQVRCIYVAVGQKGSSIAQVRAMLEEAGAGSMTGLPIVETKGNDVSAYIPTNVISITDGQIFLETDLFNQGVRPPTNVGISVSRVGGAAMIKAMKKAIANLKLFMSQYRDLEAFAAFASDLDAASRAQLERGKRLVELLKQPKQSPFPVERQVVSLWAATNGELDDVPVEDVGRFEAEFLDYLAVRYPGVYDTIRETRDLPEDTMQTLKTRSPSSKGRSRRPTKACSSKRTRQKPLTRAMLSRRRSRG